VHASPYGATIEEHFRHPRNYGSLAAPDLRHEDVNPFCGDRVRIDVALAADGTVREAKFEGDLCVIAKAASSVLTEMILGKVLDAVDESMLIEALGVNIPPARRNCALLPLKVLRGAR
jgi:nitrogen fixation NifU-like protein